MNDDFAILHPETTVVVQVKTARAAVVVDEDDEEEGEAGAEAEGGDARRPRNKYLIYLLVQKHPFSGCFCIFTA